MIIKGSGIIINISFLKYKICNLVEIGLEMNKHDRDIIFA